MRDGPAPFDEDRLDAAFRLVERQVEGRRTSYAALAVGRGFGVVRSEAWDERGAVDAPLRTAIASITKPITATAVMQLVADGALVLLEPIRSYLADFAPRRPANVDGPVEPITTWHILTHTSGMPDAGEAFYRSGVPDGAAHYARCTRTRLRFAPGTAYAYASDSFYVLSELITRLSGESYAEVLQRRIFEPLGMTATGFDPRTGGAPSRPIEGSFGPPGTPFDEVAATFAALRMPGGGLWSTTDDVVRFGLAMLARGTLDGQRILAAPFVELMTREHTGGLREVGTGRDPTYGLGWGRPGLGRGSPASAAAFGHSGATGSVLLVDPGHDLVVVYLRNEWGGSMRLADEAVQAVYGALG